MTEKETITPSIRGFLHVALRKHLSITPRTDRAARRKIVRNFLKIRTDQQAGEYMQSVRQQVREAKRSRRVTVRPTSPEKSR